MATVAESKSSYKASDIDVLEGLEAVRMRPSMYIGGVDSKGLHHLLWEIVDNSVDEYLAGHCAEIKVTLHKDGCSCTVSDNGRGIPVDKHKKYKKSDDGKKGRTWIFLSIRCREDLQHVADVRTSAMMTTT